MRYMDTECKHTSFSLVSPGHGCYHTMPDHIMAGEFHLCYKFCHHKRTNRDSAGKAVLLGGHGGLGLRRSPQNVCRPLPQSCHWPSFPLAFSLTKRLSCPVIRCELFPQGVLCGSAPVGNELHCIPTRTSANPKLCRDCITPLEVWGLLLGFSRCSVKTITCQCIFDVFCGRR